MKKKGVSNVIAYVLLIVVTLTLATVSYNYLKTFIPKNEVNCPDGLSLQVEDIVYGEGAYIEITMKNNGRFDIDAYSIRVSQVENEFISSEDISSYFNMPGRNFPESGIITFPGEGLLVGESTTEKFKLNETISKVYSFEIVPIEYVEEEGRNKIAFCSDARVKEDVTIFNIDFGECEEGTPDDCYGNNLLKCINNELVLTECLSPNPYCVINRCAECISDIHCPEGEICMQGLCNQNPVNPYG